MSAQNILYTGARLTNATVSQHVRHCGSARLLVGLVLRLVLWLVVRLIKRLVLRFVLRLRLALRLWFGLL